ncbi:MAG: PRC-barrel domain-containing protein [Janthinobacterium lividum]
MPGVPGAGTTAATPGPAEAGAVAGNGAPAAPPALPLPPSTARLAVSGVLGRTVDGSDGQDIGRVVDVLVDGSGQPRAAVIDFGGFMGLGSRKIAVEWAAFSFPPGGSDAVLRIVLSPEQIKDTPEYAGPGKPVTVVGPGTPVPRPGP